MSRFILPFYTWVVCSVLGGCVFSLCSAAEPLPLALAEEGPTIDDIKLWTLKSAWIQHP